LTTNFRPDKKLRLAARQRYGSNPTNRHFTLRMAFTVDFDAGATS
jgi:hypothetical protein